MNETIGKYFIPNAANDFHPHILHTKRTIFYGVFFSSLKFIVVGVALLLPAEVFVLPDVLAEEQRQIVELVNKARAEKGRQPLVQNKKLLESSQGKADDMAKYKYFAHARNKKTVAQWIDGVGYDYEVAGENLAVGFNTAAEIVDAWKKSPSHYANLIDSNYLDTGVGLSGGVFRGEPTVYIAQHFAAPAVPVSVQKNGAYTITQNQREIAYDGFGSVLADKLVAVRQSVPPVISISGSTPVEKYIHAKNSLGSVTKIFEVSRLIFLGALIFFSMALGLKLFINFQKQHNNIVAETSLLIAILFIFWKF